ncbi:hypothetical protein KCU92_g9858, partial [Aureobasidium melanogenum]
MVLWSSAFWSTLKSKFPRRIIDLNSGFFDANQKRIASVMVTIWENPLEDQFGAGGQTMRKEIANNSHLSPAAFADPHTPLLPAVYDHSSSDFTSQKLCSPVLPPAHPPKIFIQLQLVLTFTATLSLLLLMVTRHQSERVAYCATFPEIAEPSMPTGLAHFAIATIPTTSATLMERLRPYCVIQAETLAAASSNHVVNFFMLRLVALPKALLQRPCAISVIVLSRARTPKTNAPIQPNAFNTIQYALNCSASLSIETGIFFLRSKFTRRQP